MLGSYLSLKIKIFSKETLPKVYHTYNPKPQVPRQTGTHQQLELQFSLFHGNVQVNIGLASKKLQALKDLDRQK